MTGTLTRQGQLKKQFYRARISLNDFEEATSFLAALKSTRRDVVRRALLSSAVIAYSRPFLNNERSHDSHAMQRMRGNPTSVCTPEQKVVHERVLELRNEAIAHAQWSKYPVVLVQSNARGCVLQGRFFDILADTQLDARHFRDIAQLMHDHCVREIFDINRRIAGK